jgi:Xaa-Pro aminopeptidase
MRSRFVSLAFIPLLALPVAAAKPDAAKSADALKALRAALAAQPDSLAGIGDKDFASVPLTKADDAAARDLIWKAHAAFIKKDRGQEIKDKELKDGKLSMPFVFTTFGKKPAGGHSLWISMHGGGGAPKRVNDQQYVNQQHLYKLDEGIYLAPRAPTDNWNLWHEPHIDKLFARLIEDLVVVEGVNPDRVYIMGY